MNTPRARQTMGSMLGLTRPGFRFAVASVVVVYVAVGLTLPPLELGPIGETAAIVGSIGLATSLWLAARGDADPIGLRPALVAVILGVASAAAVWWSIPAGPGNWVRPSAPFIAYTIAMALVAVRGRIRLAWCGFVLVAAVAAVSATAFGWTVGTSSQVVVRMLLSLVPVTLMMIYVRPLLEFARVLDRREVEAVATEAAQAATLQQRRRQLADLDREVRPILEAVAAGEDISAATADQARLLEYALRDGVRGGGWISPEVRAAVAGARGRGLQVQLFDDRAVGAGTVDMTLLRGELIRVLGAADCGQVTARLLPEGRDGVAVISEMRDASVRRERWRTGVGGALVAANDGGAPSV